MTNTQYFYIKLKKDFFSEPKIFALESEKNGFLYSNIYLKLCLLSMNTNGSLMISENHPYSEQDIANLTRHKPSIVKKALETLQFFGLVEIAKPSKEILLPQLPELVGKSSTEADRKRKQRMKKSTSGGQNKGQNEGQMTANCPTHIETETKTETELELETDNGGQKGSLSGNGIPSFDEVKAYCHGKKIDVQKFYAYNQNRGWKIDGKPIRDWKKIADSWEQNEYSAQSNTMDSLNTGSTEIPVQPFPDNLPRAENDYIDNYYKNR